MLEPLPRFFQTLNMLTVRLTVSEKAAATAAFDASVARATAEGRLQGAGAFQLHKALFASAHFGCDAVTTVPDGTLIEPLPEPG